MRGFLSSIRSFLLYSNVIVTAAAAMMAFRAFKLADQSPDPFIIAMIAAATLAVYAWHSLWPDDRPGSTRDVWNRNAYPFHWICLTVGLIMLLLLAPRITGHILVLIPAVILTVYYMSAGLLKLPIHGKTLVLAMVWTYATMLMPVLLSGHEIHWSILLPSLLVEFIYIYFICFFFDHRDAGVDKPRNWSFRTPARIRAVILMIVISFVFAYFWAWASGVSRPWLIVKSMLMIFLIATSGYSLRTRSDGWYYGLLDGLLGLDIIFMLAEPSH